MNNEDKIQIASKCHDIQICLGGKNLSVSEYEYISEIGMMVRLALHIRGIPSIEFRTLKLVAEHFLQINTFALKTIVENLADIEYLKIDSTGTTIHKIIPTVPYFDDIFLGVGDFLATKNEFDEKQLFVIKLLEKLSETPLHKSQLFELGADKKIVSRNIDIGQQAGFLNEKRIMGKDIILSPSYFMDNQEVFAEIVAKNNAKGLQKINELLRRNEGWPLELIIKNKEINGSALNDSEIEILKFLSAEGIIKPPSMETPQGTTYFMFTPTPGVGKMNPGKKEIYERALALVSAVRKGQLLPKQYAIKNPKALLSSFKSKGYLNANTEANTQYKTLVFMRMCRLEKGINGFSRLSLIESEENCEALNIAIALVEGSEQLGTEIDNEAIMNLKQEYSYVESKISQQKLKEFSIPKLDQSGIDEINKMFLGF